MDEELAKMHRARLNVSEELSSEAWMEDTILCCTTSDESQRAIKTNKSVT